MKNLFGIGHDITITELAETICNVVGYKGNIEFDSDKPDGTMRKLMDSSRLNNLGWQVNITLLVSLEITYKDFLNKYNING